MGRAILSFAIGMVFAAPPAMAQSRGELLYNTHCVSCHTTEVHWRDGRAARNWAGLKFQVRRWQEAASLAWNDGDILDVSRYLNDRIYHFEQTAEPGTLSDLGGHRSVDSLAWPVPERSLCRATQTESIPPRLRVKA